MSTYGNEIKMLPVGEIKRISGLNHLSNRETITSMCNWFAFSLLLSRKYSLHQSGVVTLMYIIKRMLEGSMTTVYNIQKDVSFYDTSANAKVIRLRLGVLVDKRLIEVNDDNKVKRYYASDMILKELL